jgi:hypothetical protein
VGRWAATPVLAVLGVTLALPAAAPAAASPGTWGAGHYRYVDGSVCGSRQASTPVAAWPVDGGHSAYLTHEVVSNGVVDSAAPPVAAAGLVLPTTDVGPGSDFATSSDIAAVAYLISTSADAAQTAAAVLADTDPGGLPDCVDRSAAFELLATARDRAGPYQVSVSGPPGTLRSGGSGTVTASVTALTGTPVPGVHVTFHATGVSFAHATVTTDASGTARTTVDVPSGPGADQMAVTASVAVPVGLREVAVQADVSSTNPTGSSVPAVYVAPPTTYTGQTTVAVDRSAHPVIKAGGPDGLVQAGADFRPTATVAGLNGHSADVRFELLGPLPLQGSKLCRDLPASRWSASGVQVADSSSVPVKGDGPVHGDALTPAEAGCYAVRDTVTTVDATPAVTRHAAPDPVTALAVDATTDDTAPAVLSPSGSARTLTGAVSIGSTYGLRATLSLTVTGPIQPADGDCGATAPAWRKASTHSVATKLAEAAGVNGSGTYRYSASAPGAVGCYRARPSLMLTDGSGSSLTVPVGTSNRPVFVVHPTVTATVRQTWAISPAPVPVQVSVDGLYGLPAHVRTRMYVRPADPNGCDRVDFSDARAEAAGPSAEVPATAGVVTVDLQSGPTPKLGCYAVVPEVSVDANPTVTATGAVGSSGSTLIAGVDPNRHPTTSSGREHTGGNVALIVTAGCVIAVLLAVVGRVGLLAWRERETDPDDASGPPADLDVLS